MGRLSTAHQGRTAGQPCRQRSRGAGKAELKSGNPGPRLFAARPQTIFAVFLLFCVVCAFASHHTGFDVGLMPMAGAIACLLEENDFPIWPLILGAVTILIWLSAALRRRA